MTPTVGRIVHYFPHACDRETPMTCITGQPLAAIVALVDINGHLNLTVFDEFGNTQPRVGVKFDEGPGCAPGHCTWPPRVE